eukprot:scaffold223994_cov31-Tisochrysis_lutea.AAC.3
MLYYVPLSADWPRPPSRPASRPRRQGCLQQSDLPRRLRPPGPALLRPGRSAPLRRSRQPGGRVCGTRSREGER